MATILPQGIEITETEEKVLKNDLFDIEQWIRDAIKGKINNCKKRMIREWHPRLMADPEVLTIPANEEDIINMITARLDYKNRQDREIEEK